MIESIVPNAEAVPDFHQDGNAAWYAVHVRSNFERLVASILQHKGIDYFLPSYKHQSRWSDRVKEQDRPLFPGYLFCKLEPNHNFSVVSTRGVVSIVGIGKTPIPVEANELAAIWRVTHSDVAVAPWSHLIEGEPVVVERGPLASMEGLLVRHKSQHRLVISVTLLQRSVSVEVNAADVLPVSGMQEMLARSIREAAQLEPDSQSSVFSNLGPRTTSVAY